MNTLPTPYPQAAKETVTLEFPVMFKNTEITALSFRRPKVKDQMIADKQNKADADKEIHLMALLGEVEPELIQELDMADYEQVQQVLVGFRKKKSQSEPSKED